MIQFIPITSDTMFKEVFGKNKKAISLLLSWQLDLDYNYIYKITICTVVLYDV